MSSGRDRCRPHHAPARGGLLAPVRLSEATRRARPIVLRAAPRSSRPASHELDLALQLDAETAHDLGPSMLDERGNIGRRRGPLVHDEVSVELGDDGGAAPRALQSGGLDEPSRRVTRWVLKNAPAVLGLDGLRQVALVGELRHQALCLLPIATLELDGGVDDERAVERPVAKRRRSIPQLQIFAAPRAHVRARLKAACLDENLAQLFAPTTGVLIDRAADRAGNADGELEAAQAGGGRDARESHHLQAGAGSDAGAVDLVVGVHNAYYETFDSRARDDNVGPGPEQQVRDATQAATFECQLDRLGVGGLDEELGGSADAERSARRHRLAL